MSKVKKEKSRLDEATLRRFAILANISDGKTDKFIKENYPEELEEPEEEEAVSEPMEKPEMAPEDELEEPVDEFPPEEMPGEEVSDVGDVDVANLIDGILSAMSDAGVPIEVEGELAPEEPGLMFQNQN